MWSLCEVPHISGTSQISFWSPASCVRYQYLAPLCEVLCEVPHSVRYQPDPIPPCLAELGRGGGGPVPPSSSFPCSSLAASARDTAARKSYESVNWGAGQLQAYILPSKCHPRTRFGGTYTKIGTIQRRLAWPLRKDDTQIREAFHIFFSILS